MSPHPHPQVRSKPYPLARAFVLYCRSLWVFSRSAEHIVSAGAQIAANKNMRAAAAQSEASFTPAHCSQNHVHCNISMNSWPLRRNPKGRNACMIAFQSKQPGFQITRPKHGSASLLRHAARPRASIVPRGAYCSIKTAVKWTRSMHML